MSIAQDKSNGNPSETLSRFKLANPSDPTSFSYSYAYKGIPKLRFKLSDSERPTTSHIDPEIKIQLRSWLNAEIERQALGIKMSTQDAVSICVERALNRFMCHLRHYTLWDSIRQSLTVTSQKWQDKDDFTDFQAMISGFKVTIPTMTGYQYEDCKRRTIRLPFTLFDQLTAVAKSIGMDIPHLIQLLTIDGIRAQSETIYPEIMDAVVEDFYNQFWRRMRKLYSQIVPVWGLNLDNRASNALAELGAMIEAKRTGGQNNGMCPPEGQESEMWPAGGPGDRVVSSKSLIEDVS